MKSGEKKHKTPIRTIFIGTSDFGIPALIALISDKRFEIAGVITQPDKPVGRKQIITPPPIKTIAVKNDLHVYQPEDISTLDITSRLSDLILVIAYAQKIPENILEAPEFGCLNVHASLLPKYRGAACVQAAILNNDKEAGVSVIKMSENIDAGPILAQKRIAVDPSDTGGSLYEKLATTVPGLLIPTLIEWTSDNLQPVIQDETAASYVPKLRKQDGHIDWTNSASNVERFVRAMHPWPGAFSLMKTFRPEAGPPRAGKHKNIKTSNTLTLKIISVAPESLRLNDHNPGKLFLHKDRLAVQCGQDALIIKNLQPAGKKPMTAAEFIRGYQHLLDNKLI